MSRLPLSPDERRLITMTRPLQSLQRPAFRGHPFHLEGETTGSPRSKARFPEALIMAMIERDLLRVTQCAKDLPVWNDAREVIGTVDRPFSVQLTKEGERQRAYLIADRGIQPANDTSHHDHKTGEAA